MKLINIITHPVLVLISFCLILVSGEHIGGVYLMYFLLAIPYGGIHAVAALIGAGLVVFSYGKYKRESRFFIDPLLNILGVFALYFSLLWFFYKSWDYNNDTFQQTVPILSLGVFALVSLGFLMQSLSRFARSKPGKAITRPIS